MRIAKHLEIHGGLSEIERHFDVDIIYACESGSRAWNFASGDSDYDIRFVYVSKPSTYLTLEEPRQDIDAHNLLSVDPNKPYPFLKDFCEEHKLDFAGWDLKKTLRKIHTSNPQINEWFNSPIVYRQCGRACQLGELARSFYRPTKNFWHYMSMAGKDLGGKDLAGNGPQTTKKFLYALRCVLSAQYVLHEGKVPPVDFTALLRSEFAERRITSATYERILDLVERKTSSNQETDQFYCPELHATLVGMTIDLKDRSTSLPSVTLPSIELLDEFLFEIVSTSIQNTID